MNKIILAAVPFTLLCAGGAFCLLSMKHGVDVEEKAKQEAAAQVSAIKAQTMTLSVADKEETRNYDELVKVKSVVTVPAWYASYFETPTIDVSYEVDRTSIEYWVRSLFEEPREASLYYINGEGWKFTESYNKYAFDVETTISVLTTAVQNGDSYYLVETYLPDTTRDEYLSKAYNNLKWMNDFVISYAGEPYINCDTLHELVTDDYQFDPESVDLTPIKKALTERYVTTGTTHTFTKHDGTEISVKYNTYGKSLKWEEEEANIREALVNNTSYTPDAPAISGYDDLQDTYIEISLSEQRLWHYVDGELCCETDVVTGTRGGSRATPTGVFYISEKIPGKYLTGATWKVWVDRWMRLTNDGVGLHDSNRKSWGPTVYWTNGSHGCINLHPSFAYALYDEVKNGYPVIIYE